MSSVKLEEERPYTWIDSFGDTYRYYQYPLLKVCSFILIQETCERLAYYGIQATIKSLLRNNYGFTDTQAGSFVGMFGGLTYVFALCSAVIADTYLGAYLTILIFSVIYMTGLVMICIAAVSFIDQLWMVYVSLWFLLAVGAGGIKSCVSVLGGQQYSPVDHKDKITQFFTLFYAAINLGALIGGIAVPQVAKYADSYAIAYTIPAIAFGLATVVLMYGSPRYVRMKPQGSAVLKIFKVVGSAIGHLSLKKCRKSNGGHHEDHFIDDAQCLFTLLPVFALVVPFGMCYNQIFIGFETQSTMMLSTIFGHPMAHEMIVNVAPISVITGSIIVDRFLFPFLRRKNMMPSVLHRFCVGFILACIGNLCAMGVWFAIRSAPINSLSIWWQVPQVSTIAIGEIFVFSTSYEVAFSKSPEPMKSVAAAFNLLCFAFSGFISAGYVQATHTWSVNNQWEYYFGVLAAMCAFFATVCLFTNKYFENVFERADAHQEAVTLRSERNRQNTMSMGSDSELGLYSNKPWRVQSLERQESVEE